MVMRIGVHVTYKWVYYSRVRLSSINFIRFLFTPTLGHAFIFFVLLVVIIMIIIAIVATSKVGPWQKKKLNTALRQSARCQRVMNPIFFPTSSRVVSIVRVVRTRGVPRPPRVLNYIWYMCAKCYYIEVEWWKKKKKITVNIKRCLSR